MLTRATELYERALASQVCIPQHTSAYLRIPQHTSAYLSIPQQTSAYLEGERTLVQLSGHIRMLTYADVC
jgi:hypothetical protein